MATVSAKQSTEAQASITLPNGATVRVEIADTDATRARGLMFRNALALDEGMLFLFDEPGLHAFWMKNALISLDIIWLDDDGRIVSIAHAVAPCKADPCSHYSPSAEACAVLEVRSGVVTLHEVKVGDTVKLDGLKTASRCRAQDAKTGCPLALVENHPLAAQTSLPPAAGPPDVARPLRVRLALTTVRPPAFPQWHVHTSVFSAMPSVPGSSEHRPSRAAMICERRVEVVRMVRGPLSIGV